MTPDQKSQRLPIAVAQVKVGNTSGNLLNEMRQFVYSLYWAQEMNKTIYNTITSENSKTSDPHWLLLNLSDK